MPPSSYSRPPIPDIVTNDDRAKPTEITRDLSPLRPRRTPVLVNAPDVRWHLAPPLRAFTSLDSITSAASSSDAASTRAQVSSTSPSRLGEQQQQSWQRQHLTSFVDLHNPVPSDQGPLIHRSAHSPPFHTVPSPSSSLPASPVYSPPLLPASSPSPPFPSDHPDPETDPVLTVCPPALRAIPLDGFSPHLLSPVTEASEPGPSLCSSMLSLGVLDEVGTAARVSVSVVNVAVSGRIVGVDEERDVEEGGWESGGGREEGRDGALAGEREKERHMDMDTGSDAPCGDCRTDAAATAACAASNDHLETSQDALVAAEVENGTRKEEQQKEQHPQNSDAPTKRGVCARLGKIRRSARRLRRRLEGGLRRALVVRVLARVL